MGIHYREVFYNASNNNNDDDKYRDKKIVSYCLQIYDRDALKT